MEIIFDFIENVIRRLFPGDDEAAFEIGAEAPSGDEISAAVADGADAAGSAEGADGLGVAVDDAGDISDGVGGIFCEGLGGILGHGQILIC